jgi:hypothetical protein
MDTPEQRPRRERVEKFLEGRFNVERDAEPLRKAALAVAETFPTDWRNATFQVELERSDDGPSVAITYYEVAGDYGETAGGMCGRLVDEDA